MRFIHSADWQIGMKRHFFDEDAQARFSDARENAIRRLGQVAREYQAEFVVVAGDVFESHQLRPRTIRRALDAMQEIPVPVYLLPGNHDPLGPGSIYRQSEFVERKPAHVHVLDTEEIVVVRDGVEVVGVPWVAKQLVHDPVSARIKNLLVPSGQVRIMVGHGTTTGMGGEDFLSVIQLPVIEDAITRGVVHYLALGDRHSTTNVGHSGRVWYSGAPEPTDYDEVDAGNVLVVDLDAETIDVTSVPIGTWRFIERVLDVEQGRAEATLKSFLEEIKDKAHTIVKVNFRGTIGLLDQLALERVIHAQREVFGAIERHEHRDQLAVLPESGEWTDVNLTGFARDAFEKLLEGSRNPDPEGQRHRDALALYYRLTREG